MPPHFWALTIRHVDDYRADSVSMLPVVETSRRTMGWYSVAVALAAFTLIPLSQPHNYRRWTRLRMLD